MLTDLRARALGAALRKQRKTALLELSLRHHASNTGLAHTTATSGSEESAGREVEGDLGIVTRRAHEARAVQMR